MSTHLAAELEALPEHCIVAVEKNRWRRLWAICTGLWAAAAVAAGIVAAATAGGVYCTRREQRGGLCTDMRLDAAFPWLVVMGGAAFWALMWFAIWWACREYRPVLRVKSDD